MRFLSTKTHTIIGVVVGIALIAAPWLFAFSSVGGASVMVPVWLGVFIVVSELTTTSTLSPIKLVPMQLHLMLDYVTGVFLAASPWLFGFADEDMNAWLPHVVVGIAIVGYALVTRPTDDIPNKVM